MVEDPTLKHGDESGLSSTQSSASKGLIELRQHQVVEFQSAAFWIGLVGQLEIIFGLLMCFSILWLEVDIFIGGIVSIIVGIWTVRAARAFRTIAQRTGNDIESIVVAVSSIKKVFRLQMLLAVVAVVATFTVFLVTFLVPRLMAR